MTDNIQELDEILDEFLTDIYMNNEHFAANQEALDKTKEEPMQAILDWHNKQIEEALDRLDSKAFYDPSGTSPLINPREIQAERIKLQAGGDWQGIATLTAMKLKERDDDQL